MVKEEGSCTWSFYDVCSVCSSSNSYFEDRNVDTFTKEDVKSHQCEKTEKTRHCRIILCLVLEEEKEGKKESKKERKETGKQGRKKKEGKE
jgi:hypothetical protein